MTTIIECLPSVAQKPTPDLKAIKAKQQVSWSSGDYAIIGTTLQIVGEQLAEAMDLRAGQTTRVEPANPARFFFFKEVLPGDLDQWSAERDEALQSSSAAHTVQRYGLADLDGAG